MGKVFWKSLVAACMSSSKKWPAKFTVMRKAGKKMQDKEVSRYVKGDLVAEGTPAIPVDHKTTGSLADQGKLITARRLRREITVIILGNEGSAGARAGAPELAGLKKDGKHLVERLNKIAQAR